MKRWLAVLLMAVMLGTMVPQAFADTPQVPPMPPFTDVVMTPYERPVGYLYALGLVSGTSQFTFSPKDQVTRAQMAAFIVRALGKQRDSVKVSQKFTDVPATHWAADVVAKAVAEGIVRGTSETTFAPDAPVTYAQAVVMLLRALGYEKTLVGEYPTAHILKASELGWLKGTEFSMDAPATRGDVAIMLAAAVFTTPHADTGLTLSQSVHKKAVAVTISPDTTHLVAGSTQVKALGVDWFGKTFELQNATFSGSGSGFTLSGSGSLIITTADKVTLTVAAAGQVAERSYDVVRSISIKGGNTGLKLGDSTQLQAEGTTAGNRKVPVTPSWKIVSGPGTIAADGTLTSTGAGTIVVEATAGNLKAQITVGTAAGISVSPESVDLAPGQTQKFTVATVDDKGNSVQMPVVWSVVQGSGTITQDGTLTAGTSGPIKVQASVGGLSATATAQLITRMTISPNPASVAKGGTVQFTATGYKADGTAVTLKPVFTQTGGVGIINTSGVFAGISPGNGTVTADYFGLKASAPVTVAGEAAMVKVELSKSSLPANGKTTATVTATVVDSRGIPAQGTVETITFNLSSGTLGTLSATSAKVENGRASVTFTPSEQAGQVNIVASAPGTNLASGFASLTTVVPTISRIRLEAYPSTLAADGYSRTAVTAYLEDTTGTAIKNITGAPITITLSPGAGATGLLESSTITIPPTFTGGTTYLRATSAVGVTRISGAALYPVSPIEVRTVIVGPAAKLNIRSEIKDTKADGSETMTVYVELQDAAGNVRTGDTGMAVQLTGTSGTFTMPTLSATTVNGIATFNFTSTRAGQYNFRATTFNSTIAAAEGSGKFVAGPAYRIDMTATPSTNISADGSSTVQLVAKIVDRYGNVVTNAANQVTFTKTTNQGATSLVNPQAVTPVDGVATLSLQASATPGTDIFVASADGLTPSGAVSITSRITGNAYKLRIQPISPSTVTAGQAMTVRVHLLDALDNLVTGATGRQVVLVPSSSTAVVNGPQSSVGGVATFTVTDTRAGTVTFTASATGLISDTNGQSVTVAAGQVSTVRLEATPEGLAADGTSSTTITAKAMDANGNQVPWSTAVQLSIDNTTSGRLSSSYLYSGGQVVLYSTTTPGTITVSGSANGVSVTPLTLRTYVPAAPARVVVEQVQAFPVSSPFISPTTIRVKILDANGNLATGASTGALLSSIGVTITGSGGTNTTRISAGSNSGLNGFVPNGVTTGSTYAINGVATFQFTNTRAESVTITPIAYYGGQLLAAESVRVTTLPGAATQVAVSPDSLVLTSQVAMPMTLQAWVADQFGNPISTESDTLVFTPNTSNYLTFPDQLSVATNEGKASLLVTSKPSTSGGNTTITVKSNRTGLTRTIVVSTDVPPATPSVRATNAAGTSSVVNVSEGAVKISVTALPRQSAQNVLVYVNGRLVATYASTDFTIDAGGIGPSGTNWTGYVRTTEFSPGNNSVTVILTNGLGLSPVSAPATIVIQ